MVANFAKFGICLEGNYNFDSFLFSIRLTVVKLIGNRKIWRKNYIPKILKIRLKNYLNLNPGEKSENNQLLHSLKNSVFAYLESNYKF